VSNDLQVMLHHDPKVDYVVAFNGRNGELARRTRREGWCWEDDIALLNEGQLRMCLLNDIPVPDHLRAWLDRRGETTAMYTMSR